MNIQEEFKSIISEVIHPLLKQAGFKKKGLNFIRRNDEIQQAVTVQKSMYNSHESISFYFNIGILINNLIENKPRELTYVTVDNDFQLRIHDFTPSEPVELTITKNTDVNEIKDYLSRTISNYVIPYFDSLFTESSAIDFLINHDYLGWEDPIIKYLIRTANMEAIKTFITKRSNHRISLREHYDNFEEVAERTIGRNRNILKENNLLTEEFEKILQWNK